MKQFWLDLSGESRFFVRGRKLGPLAGNRTHKDSRNFRCNSSKKSVNQQLGLHLFLEYVKLLPVLISADWRPSEVRNTCLRLLWPETGPHTIHIKGNNPLCYTAQFRPKIEISFFFYCSEIKEYFENSYDLYETLFLSLKGE